MSDWQAVVMSKFIQEIIGAFKKNIGKTCRTMSTQA